MPRQEVKDRILETALSVFSENGYAGTTTREIAQRAGVNEVTIFRRFGSKDLLFHEVLLRSSPLSILTDDLDRRLTGHLGKDLELLANSYLEAAWAQRETIRIGLMEAPRDKDLSRLVSVIPIRLAAHLAEHLERLHASGHIPEADFLTVGKMFYSVLFQFVVSSCAFPAWHQDPETARDQWVSTLVSVFARGLGADLKPS